MRPRQLGTKGAASRIRQEAANWTRGQFMMSTGVRRGEWGGAGALRSEHQGRTFRCKQPCRNECFCMGWIGVCRKDGLEN